MMEFKRKMPTPDVVKDMYPLSDKLIEQKKANDQAIRDIFTGKSDIFHYL